LFRSTNSGLNWEKVDVADNGSPGDFAKVYFLDEDNGVVYDSNRDDIYETSDGGQSWRIRETDEWEDSLSNIAFLRSGKGIAVSKKGVNYVKEIKSGLTLRASVQSTGLRQLRLTVQRKDKPLTAANYQKTSIAVRIDNQRDWYEITNYQMSERGGNLFVDLDPTQQSVRIDPGQRIATRISLADGAGIVTAATTPQMHYLPWFDRHSEVLIPILCVLAAALLFFVLTIAVYAFSPRRICQLLGLSELVADTMREAKLGFLVPVVRLVVFDNWLLHLVARNRVVDAWIGYYKNGSGKFESLSTMVLERFVDHDRFMDCWVSAQLSPYGQYYNAVLAGLNATQYVPVSVIARNMNGEEELIVEPGPLALRSFCNSAPLVAGLVGRGGIGKTTLLGRIGVWLMERNRDERILADNVAIPILLRSTFNDVVSEIILELKKGCQLDDAGIHSPFLIRAALASRRLVLLIDGLSELDDSSQKAIQNISGELSTSLLFFSARRSYRGIGASYKEITPQELQGSDLNRFVSQYIFRNRMDSKLSPRDEIAISTRLIEMLEKRTFRQSLPALFVKLLLDTYDPQTDSQSPALSLSEAVQRFIRSIKPVANSGIVDPELLATAASELARLSLGSELFPRVMDGAVVRDCLRKLDSECASGLFKSMLDGGVLLEEVGPSGSIVSFRLDPVSEYLAAMSYIRRLGENERAWELHLGHLTASKAAAAKAAGYLEALLECLKNMDQVLSMPTSLEVTIRGLLKQGAAAKEPQVLPLAS
jgi:hypothetical protein